MDRLGQGCSLSFREKFKEPNGHTTSNRRRSDVDIMSLSQRPNFDNFPRRFDVLFRCNFADRKIHVVSTYFFRYNFDGPKIHVVSTYFFWRNFYGRKIHLVSTYFFWCIFAGRNIHVFFHVLFDVISMVEKSTLFPRTFFDVISLVKKSPLFSLTLFHVILMAKKSTLLGRTFFEEISTGKNSTLFLVKLQAKENIQEGFPLSVALKNWLLQKFFSLNFFIKSPLCGPFRLKF